MGSLMKRFEFIPGSHKPRLMRNGLIVVGVCGFVAMFAFLGGTVPFWPKGGYTVKAEFDTAANVTTKTPVRVRGVKVGKVEKVERREGGNGVVVTMRITDDGFKLRRDARADIYWRTLLGFAFYIQLEPGSDQQALGEDGLIPLKNTTAQVELDQVLASLKKPSREGMQAIFREFDKGFDQKQGSKSGQTIENLGPAMKQIGPGLDALRGTESGDLSNLVRNSSRLMGALARNEVELGQVVTNANTALGVTAARRADLGSILRDGPRTLDDTRTTMARVRTTLEILDPIAESLRPGSRRLDEASIALRPALRELTPLLTRADPLLEDLRPTFARLGRASDAGVPLMEELDPTLKRLNDELLPGFERVNKTTGLKMFQSIGPTATSVGASAQQFDDNGHIQRFNAIAGGEQSISTIPCSTDFLNGSTEVDCSDFQAIVGAILGIPPARTGSKRLTGSPGRGGKPAPSSAPSAGGLVKKLADTLGGVL